MRPKSSWIIMDTSSYKRGWVERHENEIIVVYQMKAFQLLKRMKQKWIKEYDPHGLILSLLVNLLADSVRRGPQYPYVCHQTTVLPSFVSFS